MVEAEYKLSWPKNQGPDGTYPNPPIGEPTLI